MLPTRQAAGLYRIARQDDNCSAEPMFVAALIKVPHPRDQALLIQLQGMYVREGADLALSRGHGLGDDGVEGG